MERRKILVWYLLFQESFSKEDKNQSGIIDMQSFQVNILTERERAHFAKHFLVWGNLHLILCLFSY